MSDTLEIGGGRQPASASVNMDIATLPTVDVVADICQPWPFRNEQFRWIEAHQVFEHVGDSDLTTVFEQAFRTLVPGGTLHVDVPLAHSKSAVSDPTHRSNWYWRTPAYYTQDDEYSYYNDIGFELRARRARLFLASGRAIARPLSWLLKHSSLRTGSSLVELVKLPYVTGVLEFVLRKPVSS